MTSAATILLAEDDRTLRHWVTSALETAGYTAVAVADGIQAAQQLRSRRFDVLLLDIGLPFVDGWAILAELNMAMQPTVIVVSARGDERDKVRALDMGADDYLTKPFGADELLARVRVAVRRLRRRAPSAGTVACNGVVVDLGGRAVSRDGEEVHLSPTEWAVLVELARAAGRVVEHRSLLARVWGPEFVGDRNYLRTFVQRLRRKLESDPAHPEVIVTAGRQGYRFGPMRSTEDAPGN